MYCLSNVCFMCLNDKNSVDVIFLEHGGNEIVQQVKFVLPEITILEPRLPLSICSTCRKALQASHNFKKMCLESNCQYNSYIRKLQGSNDSVKRKFGELEVKISEHNLLTTLKEESNMDSNIERMYKEENLVEDELDIKETLEFPGEFSFTEDRANSLFPNILQQATELNSAYNLLTTVKEESNMDWNIERMYKKENLVEDELDIKETEFPEQFSFSEDRTNSLSPNILQQATELNSAQDSYRNENFGDQIIKEEIQASEEEKLIIEKQTKVHTEQKKYECLICNKLFTHKQIFQRHKKSHRGVKDFKCLICNKLYAQKKNLKIHMRIHTGVKDYECSLCNTRFGRKEHLQTHIKVYTGEKDYECCICNKKFESKCLLKIHMTRHPGKNKCKCSICNKFFACKKNLKKHMSIHTNIENYKCSICNKMFRWRDSLTFHIKMHTDPTHYKCTICNNIYVYKTSLTRHMLSHTDVKNYKCSICNNMYNCKASLTRHMFYHM